MGKTVYFVETNAKSMMCSIKFGSSEKDTVVHVDRLKKFQGEVPAHWKDSVDGSEKQKAGPHDRQSDREADREAVGREAVQSSVRPSLTAKVHSKQYQGSSIHSANTGQQNNTARRETVSDKPGATLQQARGVINDQTVCVLIHCRHPTCYAHLHSAPYRRVFGTFKLQISKRSDISSWSRVRRGAAVVPRHRRNGVMSEIEDRR